MDILKKSLRTVIAVMALTLFAACNFELKNHGSQPSPQKEETVKELAARMHKNREDFKTYTH